MNYEGNASYLYVGNVASTAADAAAINTIAAGSVAFCTEDGKVEKTAITTGKVRLAQKFADGKMVFSPFFDRALLQNINGAVYAAPAQQISYIGYNGTDGSMTVAAGEDYVVNIEWKNTAGMYNNKPLLLTGAYHTTAASQLELANGLMESLGGMMKRQPYKFIKIERVGNGATTELAADTTVVNGTTTVASAGHGMAADDFVSLQGVTYQLASATTNAFVLDYPYTGVSETIDVSATVKLAASEVTPTAWGLKFTGVEGSTFDALVDNWSVTSFGLISGDFPAAEIRTSTAPSSGQGYYKEVANIEAYAQFLDKASVLSAYPQSNIRSEVSSAKTYDIYSFDVKELVSVSVGTGLPAYKSFRISIATDVALSGDSINTVLGV